MLFYKEKEKPSVIRMLEKTNIYFKSINGPYRKKYCHTTIYCCKYRFYEVTYNQHNNWVKITIITIKSQREQQCLLCLGIAANKISKNKNLWDSMPFANQ